MTLTNEQLQAAKKFVDECFSGEEEIFCPWYTVHIADDRYCTRSIELRLFDSRDEDGHINVHEKRYRCRWHDRDFNTAEELCDYYRIEAPKTRDDIARLVEIIDENSKS